MGCFITVSKQIKEWLTANC